MLNVEQYIGKTFGKLKIVSLEYKKQKYNKNNKKDGFLYYFNCVCTCGKNVIVNLHDLTSKHTQSCGCFQKEQTSNKNKVHGLTHSRLHNIWVSLKQRCYNINNQAYKNYGGRGIAVCNEWKNDFITFYNWAINNGYKEDLTIDRIDVNSNYYPENCRWITKAEQNRNYRRNVYVIYKNKKYCLKSLAEKFNINYKIFHKKYKKGISIEDIINSSSKKGQELD